MLLYVFIFGLKSIITIRYDNENTHTRPSTEDTFTLRLNIFILFHCAATAAADTLSVRIANKYMPRVNSIMFTCFKWLQLAVQNGVNDIICYEHKITFNQTFVGCELIWEYTSFLKIFISIGKPA